MNNGTTFDPIFDTYGTGSIGDLALAPSNPNILYVGTGEAEQPPDSLVRQRRLQEHERDGGQAADVKFEYIGLRETQSIARMHRPSEGSEHRVGRGVGHLFGPNPERGVFMTTDGGKTWKKTLYDHDQTRARPTSSSTRAIRTTCGRRRTSVARTAWGFVGGGPGSGIHQSTDGGKTWNARSPANGLPRGTMGRIGARLLQDRTPNVIYAQIEVAPDKETGAALDQPAPATPAAAAAAGGRGGGRRRGRRRRGGGGGGGGGGGRLSTPNPQA